MLRFIETLFVYTACLSYLNDSVRRDRVDHLLALVNVALDLPLADVLLLRRIATYQLDHNGKTRWGD